MKKINLYHIDCPDKSLFSINLLQDINGKIYWKLEDILNNQDFYIKKTCANLTGICEVKNKNNEKFWTKLRRLHKLDAGVGKMIS